MSFGKQRDGRGVSFSRFRTHYYLEESEAVNSPSLTPEKMKDGDDSAGLQNTPAELGLGRSGRCFQLSWSLKTVVKRAPAMGAPLEWSTRSVGLYHQFDIENGRTLWITTSGREDIQLRVQDLTGRNAKPENIKFDTPENSLRLSFHTHLLFCQWAMEGWPEYLQYLEELVEQEVGHPNTPSLASYRTDKLKTQMALDGDCEPGHRSIQYTSSALQDIQRREDRVQATLALLEANAEAMSSLRHFYLQLDNDSFPLRGACGPSIKLFTLQIHGCIADMRLLMGRARTLVMRTSSRKNLVVQHLQSQAAEETSNLAKAAQKETIAMRVIAFITVLYLPATFVSVRGPVSAFGSSSLTQLDFLQHRHHRISGAR